MICNVLVVLIGQLLAWGLGYNFADLYGALIGIFIATVLGCLWHALVYFITVKRIKRRSKYASPQHIPHS